MPEVDGLDILRYVRSNTLLEDLPVISECGMLCCGVLWRGVGWGVLGILGVAVGGVA